ATLFFIFSLWLYVNSRLAIKKEKKHALAAGCILAALLSLGTKEIAATLPFFIFLYEWYFFQDLSRDWLKRYRLGFAGLTALTVLAALIYLGHDPLGRLLAGYNYHDFTVIQRLLTEFRVVVFYLSLLVWPHPSRLNLDHDFALSRSLVDPLSTLLSIGAVAGLVGLAIYTARRQRLLSYTILWFLGNLVIESSIIGLEIIFEHRTYLPSMLAVMMAVTVIYNQIKPPWIATAILCGVAVVGSFWTYERNRVWVDAVTLWQDCAAKSPRKARPHNNLGSALADQERIDAAIDQFYTALKLKPDYEDAHYNLGYALIRRGELEAGQHHLFEALRLDPQNYLAHNNLGVAYWGQGHLQAAVHHFQQALRIKPDFAIAHNNLGSVVSRLGDSSKAIHHFSEAVRLDPQYAQAHNNLGVALGRQGLLEAAREHFAKAVRIAPGNAEAQRNLDQIRKQLERASAPAKKGVTP
ncbi:MAG: tetratricopeptide repeat protein, partial [Desulfobacterales bacterium]